MEADPDFDKDIIGIDGEDVRKVEKELVQYNSELDRVWFGSSVGFVEIVIMVQIFVIMNNVLQRTWCLQLRPTNRKQGLRLW